MKKNFVVAAVVMLSIPFVSCQKEELKDDMMSQLADFDQMVTVTSNDYERVVTDQLVLSDEGDIYTSGVIEYRCDGNVDARIDFGAAGADRARCYDGFDGAGRDYEMRRRRFRGKKCKFKKVVVEPLVYSQECGYVVSGIIKFFDRKSDKWVCTFDWGDGTCDDLIDKHTHDGVHTFSMNDHPAFNQ